MIESPKSHVENLMENEKNWLEHFSTAETIRLMKTNADICEEKIKVLENGYIVERTAFPKMYLNKYFLYEFLKRHKRVPKCQHAEKVLKKSATEKGK